MKASRTLALLLVVAAAGLGLTGCVSSQLQLAGPGGPPPEHLGLQSTGPGVSAAVEHVIIFDGPGSWKHRAFWDEYAITVSNPGSQPIKVLGAKLYDEHGASLTPAEQWEELERQSSTWWERHGTVNNVTLGATRTVSQAGAAISTLFLTAAICSTPAAIPYALTALCVTAAPTEISNSMEKNADFAITREFEQRRFKLPRTIAPDSTQSGSLFFRITPSPTRLVVEYLEDGARKQCEISLAPLAQLHRRTASPEKHP